MPTPRHILLAVAGNTAATVTEAIYALGVQRKIVLAEVIVLTTQSARAQLQKAFEDVLPAMRKDFPRALREFKLDVRAIELDDIRTSRENDQTADWILRQVHDLCTDADTVIHASMAGGRKTMGYYLGASMELLGRPQDRLYHVLVSPEFEVPGFYYPAPKASRFATVTVKGLPRATADAEIEMADVPFVKLRHRVADMLPTKGTNISFQTLVMRARDAIGQDYVDVHVELNTGNWGDGVLIRYGSDSVDSPKVVFPKVDSKEVVALLWVLWNQQQNQRGIHVTDWERFPQLLREYDSFRRDVLGLQDSEDIEEIEKWYKKKLSAVKNNVLTKATFHRELRKCWYTKYFSYHPSRLEKKILSAFRRSSSGIDPSKYYLQAEDGNFFVTIPGDKIHFHSARDHRRGKKR